MPSQIRRGLLQPGERQLLRLTEVHFSELSAPLAVGAPVLFVAARPALLTGGEGSARTLKRERAGRPILQPRGPGGRVDRDLRRSGWSLSMKYPVSHVRYALRHSCFPLTRLVTQGILSDVWVTWRTRHRPP